MVQDALISDLEKKMQKALQFVLTEFGTIRTGRASTAMVENVSVEVYGSKMPLREMAAITTPDAKTICITPWDRGTAKAIEKAILMANLGFTPIVDAERIRCNIPEMSRERRQEMVKMANTMAEAGRVSVRTLRRETLDSFKSLEKAKKISEDDLKRADREIQKITDRFIEEVNKILAAKEKDLLSI